MKSVWPLVYNLTWVRFTLSNAVLLDLLISYLERDSQARKSGKSGTATGGVDVFRGLSFDDWLRIFMQVRFFNNIQKPSRRLLRVQYGFTMTKRGQYESAEEVLRHILLSNAYQAKERQVCIRLALMGELCHIHYIVVFNTKFHMCF